MREGAEQPSKRLGYAIAWSLVILIAIPLCYVLSMGPVFGMAARGWISDAAKDAYVSPGRAILQHDPRQPDPRSIIVRMLDVYISLWMP